MKQWLIWSSLPALTFAQVTLIPIVNTSPASGNSNTAVFVPVTTSSPIITPTSPTTSSITTIPTSPLVTTSSPSPTTTPYQSPVTTLQSPTAQTTSILPNANTVHSSSSSTRISSVVVVITTQGQTVTMTGTDPTQASSLAAAAASSAAAALNGHSTSSSSNAKAWIIPISIIAGLAVLSGVIFVIYKFSNRRFSDLDDDEAPIKWPELRAAGSDDTVLNPPVTRRVTGAGIDLGSEFGDDSSPRPSLAYPLSNSRTSSAPTVPYFDDPRQSYYDPYLGTSNYAPPPLPPGADSSSHGMVERTSSGGVYSGYTSNDVTPPNESSFHYPSDETTPDPDGISVRSVQIGDEAGPQLGVVNPD